MDVQRKVRRARLAMRLADRRVERVIASIDDVARREFAEAWDVYCREHHETELRKKGGHRV